MDMTGKFNRRNFVKGAVLTSASLCAVISNQTEAAQAQGSSSELPPMPSPKASLPTGKIGKVEFSRLMLGGNLIGGYAHSRELQYVGTLMKRYNTEAKILETLELAETHGINCINTPVWDNNVFLEKHWKRGGKMKWIAQAKVGPNYSLDFFKKAVDMGASGVHMQGHVSESMIEEERIDVIAKSVELVKSQGVAAGVGAHGLRVIMECEKAKIDVDFYVKTLHPLKYPSAPKPGETDRWGLGRWDNCWCNNPEEVIEFMEDVKKPWIAFKVMAAGAISPQFAFKYAFDSGADFILAGMFDWQVIEDANIAREAVASAKRTRPWRS